MKLEVLCLDRLGLTQELLELLVARHIDLRGIEIDVRGKIYLNCTETDFELFRELMVQIRLIQGVTDVRTIQFMPSERENHELFSLLNNMPQPILSLNTKGEVDKANKAALQLFGERDGCLPGSVLSNRLSGFSYSKWLDAGATEQSFTVIIDGLDYDLDAIPIYIKENETETMHASTLVSIRSKSMIAAQPVINEPSRQARVFEHLVGRSSKHKVMISQAKKLAPLNQPLLIQGETGTGKEVLARACHDSTLRSAHPFLILSCASMPDDVAETELFGHAAGQFNQSEGHKGIFELADGGTVFLDEIGEMSPHLQMKLVRFLQDGTFRRVGEEEEVHVDVRVIASTAKNLAGMVDNHAFREDLYFRLNVLNLTIPPLRERLNDVEPLLEHFIAKHSRDLGVEKAQLTDDGKAALADYQWPGNIRELENATLRALSLSEGQLLDASAFDLKPHALSQQGAKLNLEGSLESIMKAYEAQIIQTLYLSFPSSRKLAKRLGVSHTSIANKLRDYEINKHED
ncbi:transcriptional regulator TyrR [Vibrio ulleungensis]|uniref:HTH-type transcriptional regulatory protein TyrR n=1 Tax=Vibrio ulleungensis TaxID=2807619 RepID=A0ABS2HFK8_9VIBR|nr:transcriptional regulator TyrR [Vibrio ulleungensis]MBM7035891.1 transcriptional regulator TyrR [Vibrio ulleungensis]